MNNTTPPQQPKRSELVTITAWLNIALCGLSALVSAGLMALFATLVPVDEIMAAIHAGDGQQIIPPHAEFAITHIQALLGLALGVSLVMVVASFALLRRKNWARLFWIACFAVIAVWSIAGLFYQPDLSWFTGSSLAAVPPEIQAQLQQTIETAKIGGYVVSIVQAVLLSWLIWRFVSPDIREEFKAR